jgi:small subunit ribosomal protein S8
LRLRYAAGGQPVIRELKRVSTPGLRRYVGVNDIPRVRNGLGVAILSTSKGLMSDRQARQSRTGGELVAVVW